jgi:hypothetical protein
VVIRAGFLVASDVAPARGDWEVACSLDDVTLTLVPQPAHLSLARAGGTSGRPARGASGR